MAPPSPFLSVFELGPQQSEHPVKLATKLTAAVLGVLLVGGGIAALLAAAIGLLRMGAKETAQELAGFCLPGILAPIGLGIGGWCLSKAWNQWGSAVAVFDRGFAVSRWEDVRPVPWEDVTAVWQATAKHSVRGVPTGIKHKYTVQLVDDTKYVWDDKYQDVETLGRVVQSKVSNLLYPKYSAALKAGSRLEFGPLALDYNKLYSRGKELPWDDVKSVKIQGGFLQIKKDNEWLRWASAGVPQIPNFFIFYALLKEFNLIE
ncbi:MAG: hypothetical protein JW929_04525 [Anaerolineales bacterium]|nr:hypothetical protein [Anaerolineales bacterium]